MDHAFIAKELILQKIHYEVTIMLIWALFASGEWERIEERYDALYREEDDADGLVQWEDDEENQWEGVNRPGSEVNAEWEEHLEMLARQPIEDAATTNSTSSSAYSSSEEEEEENVDDDDSSDGGNGEQFGEYNVQQHERAMQNNYNPMPWNEEAFEPEDEDNSDESLLLALRMLGIVVEEELEWVDEEEEVEVEDEEEDEEDEEDNESWRNYGYRPPTPTRNVRRRRP